MAPLLNAAKRLRLLRRQEVPVVPIGPRRVRVRASDLTAYIQRPDANAYVGVSSRPGSLRDSCPTPSLTMACIRKRRRAWVVDWRDALGIRRWKTCRTIGQRGPVGPFPRADVGRPAAPGTRPIAFLPLALTPPQSSSRRQSSGQSGEANSRGAVAQRGNAPYARESHRGGEWSAVVRAGGGRRKRHATGGTARPLGRTRRAVPPLDTGHDDQEPAPRPS